MLLCDFGCSSDAHNEHCGIAKERGRRAGSIKLDESEDGEKI